jgi:glycosyltransferase involved in cell wall biosynthesis
VLLVTRFEPDHFGGVQRSTMALALALRTAGHDVRIMCNSDHEFAAEFVRSGFPVVFAPLKIHFGSLLRDLNVLRGYLCEHEVDIVHFQYAFSAFMAPFCRTQRRNRRPRTVWSCRGIRRGAYPVMGWFATRFVDFVIGNCRQEQAKLIEQGIPANKVGFAYNPPALVIPNDTGRDRLLLDELGIDPARTVIGTASRLSPERGVEYFIEAAAKLLARFPELTFVIAGSGPSDANLRLLSEALGVGSQMRFLGTRHDMARVYSIFDIFVNPLPSSYAVAGTGNTTAEAMVCSRPVVTTNAGGIAEMVIDGVTGLVVESRDSEALATACARLLEDPALREDMGRAGRERILSQFTSRHLAERLESYYFRVIGRHNFSETVAATGAASPISHDHHS